MIFGDRARDDQELTELLEKLMGEANRIVGLSESDDYYEFYGRLERQLRDPEPGSLLARFADAPQTDRTRVVHQIPHWIFAMRDTLGANTYRALAAIVARPGVERRVRRSWRRDLATRRVDGLATSRAACRRRCACGRRSRCSRARPRATRRSPARRSTRARR